VTGKVIRRKLFNMLTKVVMMLKTSGNNEQPPCL
jgi:hypothetical protein